MIFLDIIQVLACALFNIAWWQWISRSGKLTDRTIGAIIDVPWQDHAVTLDDKISSFFQAMTDALDMISTHTWLQNIFFYHAFLLVMRTIKATSVHPRIALVTSTLVNAASDLWHFLIMISIISSSFALMGTWSFGDAYPNFSTWFGAIVSQIDIVLGTLPEYWTEDFRMAIYVALCLFIFFFLLLNVLLSIIVDAYMKVKEELLLLTIEKDFAVDAGLSYWNLIKWHRFGWPRSCQLSEWLDKNGGETVISQSRLQKLFTEAGHHGFSEFLDTYIEYCGIEHSQETEVGKATKGGTVTSVCL